MMYPSVQQAVFQNHLCISVVYTNLEKVHERKQDQIGGANRAASEAIAESSLLAGHMLSLSFCFGRFQKQIYKKYAKLATRT